MDKNLSYLKGPTDKPLVNKTIGNLVEEAKAKYKDKVFIISKHEERNVTFGEVIKEADNLALGLIQIGLKAGDKIGIIVNNSIEAFVANIACVRGGFVTVNLNPSLQPRELEFCVNEIEINCIISLDSYKNFSVLDVIKKVVPELESSEFGILESTNVPSLKYVAIISGNNYKGTFNYEGLKTKGKHSSKEYLTNNQNQVGVDDIFTVLFTSGTTGQPKAVGIKHFQIYNCVTLLRHRMKMDQQPHKFCFYVPLFHLFGIAFELFSLQSGHPLVLPSFYYNPEQNLKAISEEKCTYIMGTPTMFSDLIRQQKKLNLPLSPHSAFTGAAFCSEKVFNEIKEVLNVKNIGIGYGSSEALGVSWPTIEDGKVTTSTSLGDFVDHLEAKIVDPEGNIVPIGVIGELYVKGYSVIDNYWSKNPNKISSAFEKDGWFRTGDAFFMDKEKKLYIAGRLKDIINRGGEKISPTEIEEIIETHPHIDEVCVVGTHHQRLGEEVCACIRVIPGSTVTLDDIKNFCKGKISYYKIPTRIEIVDYIPKTNVGKIQRAKLLEQIEKRGNSNN